jgi:hypothetical protein
MDTDQPMGQPMPLHTDLISEAHEERIQRLESNMEKVVAQTAASSVKLDHLTDLVKEGFVKIGERFEKGADQFDHHSKQLEHHKASLQKLNQAEAVRAGRWKWARKLTIPILIAVGSGVATHFGENTLSTWLSHLIP